MKKKILIIFSTFCIWLSLIALSCDDVVIPPEEPPPSGNNYRAISLYTGDGGNLWYTSNIDKDHNSHYRDVQGICSFLNGLDTLCLIADDDHILKSTNFGANWLHIQEIGDPLVLRGITNTETQGEGFIVANFGIKVTVNSGLNWSSVSIPGNSPSLWAIAFGNNGAEGIVIPEYPGGTTLITTNGGLSWAAGSQITPNYFINDIRYAEHFPNSRALVCGNSGKIFETTDYGGSWTEINSPVNQDLASIAFDGDGAIIVGSGGVILRSIDFGEPFILMSSGISNNLRKVYISGNSTYWAVGDNVIIKSIDRGQTWTIVRSAANEYYKDLIVSGDQVVVVGSRQVSE